LSANTAVSGCAIFVLAVRRGEPMNLTPDNVDHLPPAARAFQVSLVHFMDHLVGA
jgi:hypothetical protein